MKNIKVLEDLYDSAIEKRREARENIIVNEDRIREIDEFLNQAKETEEDIRLVREAQADRMTSYHFKLWMMERMKKDDGHKGIH